MSKTIVALLVALAGLFGVADIFTSEEVSIVVNNTMQTLGIFGAWYGRVVASGKVDWLGRK